MGNCKGKHAEDEHVPLTFVPPPEPDEGLVCMSWDARVTKCSTMPTDAQLVELLVKNDEYFQRMRESMKSREIKELPMAITARIFRKLMVLYMHDSHCKKLREKSKMRTEMIEKGLLSWWGFFSESCERYNVAARPGQALISADPTHRYSVSYDSDSDSAE